MLKPALRRTSVYLLHFADIWSANTENHAKVPRYCMFIIIVNIRIAEKCDICKFNSGMLVGS